MTQVVKTPFGFFVVWARFEISEQEALQAVITENPPFGMRVFPCADEQEAQALQEVLA